MNPFFLINQNNDDEEERRPTIFQIDEETGVYFYEQAYAYLEQLVQEENRPRLTRNPIYRDREGAEERLMVDYFDDHCSSVCGKCVGFEKGYYLADGIYPQWATFVKSFTDANDAKHAYFKKRQESERKDVERAGVLQGRRAYEAYEQFQAMTNQQAEGSGSGIKRTRTYIPRDQEKAEQRLLEDYFGNDNTPPKYPKENFRRRCRISSTLFAKIVNDITSYDAQPLPEYFWSNNDLNVLYGSPLFDDVLADTAPEAPFVVNGRTYKQGYYLADGIYPTWSTFVKTFSIARDEKTLKFKRVQESARKDIERAFGVLQGRWGIIRQPARALQINTLKRIMYCCIILHNMILQSEKFELSNFKDMFVNPETNMQRTWIERCDLHVRRSKELRDSLVHNELRHDLVNHLWNLDH
ncbi:ALP1-like protein isoform X1 [Tanacetum coccineum]